MSSNSNQKNETTPIDPKIFRRIGQKGFRWELPRTFHSYFADTKTAVGGAATKYILRTDFSSDPQYIVKYAQKHGIRETLTEFFINQLGESLQLDIAHSGLILSDSLCTFATRIFKTDDETLSHGSLIIEDCFKREQALDSRELERIHHHSEQEFYSIDFVVGVLKEFCGKDFDSIMPLFIEMLVFDALVGSMDRHSQNWGVLAKSRGPTTYRFSPIFDTSRSLLWNLDEDQIMDMYGNGEKQNMKLERYIEFAKPCMGPERKHPKVNKCNHFDFVQNLLTLYPEPTQMAVRRVTRKVEIKTWRILRQFPFRMAFTGNRKRLILKILTIRAAKLREILDKGGA